MQLNHIVVAVDESEAGRHAVRAALDLAARNGARLTVMTVVLPQSDGPAPALTHLERWIEPELAATPDARVSLGIAVGVPGIEICRFAEERHADLLVLGRKARSQIARLLVGDTADAVARRSQIPCLLVPAGLDVIGRVLAAADGSQRGMVVVDAAMDFAQAASAEFRVATVDRVWPGETPALAAGVGSARTAKLAARIEENRTRHAAAALRGGDRALRTRAASLVELRHGEIVDEVLAAVGAHGADVLAVGYRRGGAPGVIEAGSTARRLAHTAPCAVLTVPL